MDDRRSLEHEGEQQRHRRLCRAGARPQGCNNAHPALMLTPEGIETPAHFPSDMHFQESRTAAARFP
jgi:hypothetical protein